MVVLVLAEVAACWDMESLAHRLLWMMRSVLWRPMTWVPFRSLRLGPCMRMERLRAWVVRADCLLEFGIDFVLVCGWFLSSGSGIVFVLLWGVAEVAVRRMLRLL